MTRVNTGLGHQDFRGNSTLFRGMGVPKVSFLVQLLRLGYSVGLSDTDVAWLGDPMKYLEEEDRIWPAADVLASSDSLSHENDVSR